MTNYVEVFRKIYSDEDLYDLDRNMPEAIDERFNPVMASFPKDENGFIEGSFEVSIVWRPKEC